MELYNISYPNTAISTCVDDSTPPSNDIIKLQAPTPSPVNGLKSISINHETSEHGENPLSEACEQRHKDMEKIAASGDPNNVEEAYPTGLKLAMIVLSLVFSVFLVALDETIIATAIPKITDEFKALDDVGWYGSAYFLTTCSFQLLYGKIYTFFPLKWVFFAAVAVFELGSVVCATAPTSVALIVGRGISGLGSAGINSGFIIIIANSLPLARRPIIVSAINCMYGIASVTAPLMGGAFTTRLTWRLCFWINLPFGVVTMITIGLFVTATSRSRQTSAMTLKAKFGQLDVLGTSLFIPAIVCVLLVLQWGGSTYKWSDGRVVSLLVVSAVLLSIFIYVQHRKQEEATIPPRIMKQRSVASAAFFLFSMGGAFNILEYFLPIWFQAVQGVTALESGIRILPTILGLVLFAFIAGLGVSRSGYYVPFMIAGSVFLAAGAGLLSAWQAYSSTAVLIGYQIPAGIGGGLGIPQAHLAAQTVLGIDDVPVGAVLLIFAQIFGGTLFISIAENVFTNRLVVELRTSAPRLDPGMVLRNGATGLKEAVAAADLDGLLHAYNRAVTQTFYVAATMASLALIGALGTEWRSVRKAAK